MLATTAPAEIVEGEVLPSYGSSGAEQWVLGRLEEHKVADFDERCKSGVQDSSLVTDPSSLRVPCRRLPPEFIVRLLTREQKGIDAAGGLHIRHAWISGALDLEKDKLTRAFELDDSFIDDVVKLDHAQTEKFLSFDGSVLAKGLKADGFRSGSDLSLKRTTINPLPSSELTNDKAMKQVAVSLSGAKVEGALDATEMTVIGSLNAYSLEVSNSLTLANINIAPPRSSLSGAPRSAAGLESLSTLHCDNSKTPVFADLEPDWRSLPRTMPCASVARSERVDPPKEAVGHSLPTIFSFIAPAQAQTVWQPPLEARRSPERDRRCSEPIGLTRDESKAFEPELSLSMAKVGRRVNLNSAILNVRINADSMHVDGDLFMRNVANCAGANMVSSSIAGSADLSDIHSADFDFRGATIGNELRLADNANAGQKSWFGNLDLRYAHVSTLVDERGAWPSQGHLRLDGFSFQRLASTDAIHRTLYGATCDAAGGAISGDESSSSRKVDWWDTCWARSDIEYSPTPYDQLASAAKNSGFSFESDEMRYLGRERQTASICERKWQGEFWSCFIQTALGNVAGYGIGLKSFVVLWWVIGATLVGASLLWLWVPAAREKYRGNSIKGLAWCLGASFARLLPVIKLNEFEGFFEDPEKAGFTLRQRFAFSLLGLCGWILAAILGVAISGLTQGS